LETICLKCLAKRPAERYADALELADDLHRFLGGETVLARPAGRGERLLKWARRRPALATVYGLLVLVAFLGSGAGGAVWLWQQAEEASRDATAARDMVAKEKKQTEEALERATAAQQAETRAKDQLDRVLDLHKVSLAHQAIRDYQVALALRLLEECLP